MSQLSQLEKTEILGQFSTLDLAQALAERLTIKPNDWHRLKANRKAQANQQVAAAIIFLLKERPQEALMRLNQASGWLDHSISTPLCPDHEDSQNPLARPKGRYF